MLEDGWKEIIDTLDKHLIKWIRAAKVAPIIVDKKDESVITFIEPTVEGDTVKRIAKKIEILIERGNNAVSEYVMDDVGDDIYENWKHFQEAWI